MEILLLFLKIWAIVYTFRLLITAVDYISKLIKGKARPKLHVNLIFVFEMSLYATAIFVWIR